MEASKVRNIVNHMFGYALNAEYVAKLAKTKPIETINPEELTHLVPRTEFQGAKLDIAK